MENMSVCNGLCAYTIGKIFRAESVECVCNTKGVLSHSSHETIHTEEKNFAYISNRLDALKIFSMNKKLKNCTF